MFYTGIPFPPAPPPPPPPTPELEECGVDEAVRVLVEMGSGKYWAACEEFKLARARKDGYVIAKRRAA